MISEQREKTVSISNIVAAIEEKLHQFGELKEDEHIKLPWKVQQIPITIYKEVEVTASK